MSHLDKEGLERVRQHIATEVSGKADKIILEDGTVLNLIDVYNAIPEAGAGGGSTSEGEGNNSTIIGGSENAIATGDNSVVIGESGTAAGVASIAGGTNNPEVIKNLTWTTSTTEPSELPPAQALGDASIAVGAGSTTYTAGSVAIGTSAKAGAKGFYWYDYENYETTEDFIETNTYSIRITQDIIDNGIYFKTFCPHKQYDLYGEQETGENFSSSIISSEEVDNGDGYVFIHYATVPKETLNGILEIEWEYPDAETEDICMSESEIANHHPEKTPTFLKPTSAYSGVKVRLSLTQPRISYNPEEIGEPLDDGTWAQEREWSSEAQELLEGWSPIDDDYAVISFYGGVKYINCSKVLEVLEDGYIVVDSLPDPWGGAEPYTTIQWDEYLIFVPLRPEAGLIEASLGSFAIGLETAASGMASFAQGFGSHAAGSYAVATGLATEAGYAALSGGERSRAAGNFSMAMGLSTTTTGKHSMALGHLVNANGESAIAMNSRTTANGKYSTAMGRNTIASGQSQLVIGKHNIEDTNDDYAFIVGMGSSSNKQNAFTVDWDGNGEFSNEVYASDLYSSSGRLVSENELDWSNITGTPYTENGSGSRAVILNGGSNVATAAQASVMGTGSTAGGKYSLAGGNGSKTSGDQSLAFGHQCVASAGSAIALGRKVQATHNYSTAFGNSTRTSATDQTVLGKYNANNTNALFIIGNGKAGTEEEPDKNRSNAFTVDTSGNGIFSGTITMNGNQKLTTRTLTIEYESGDSETIQMVVV